MTTYEQLLAAIRTVQISDQQSAKQKDALEGWMLGKLIEVHAAQHKMWGNYSQDVDQWLARDLNLTLRELQEKRYFARVYPQIPPFDLGWGNYYELLDIKDIKLRDELASQAEKEQWPREKLREEIGKRLSGAGAPPLTKKENHLKPPLEDLKRYPRVKTEDGSLALDLGFGIFHTGERIDSFQEKEQETSFKTYEVTVTQVVDGDTFDARVDLGFSLITNQRFRLARLNTSELGTQEGTAAKAFLVNAFTQSEGKAVLQVRGLDKFRRYVSEIWIKQNSGDEWKNLNDELLAKGLATPYLSLPGTNIKMPDSAD